MTVDVLIQAQEISQDLGDLLNKIEHSGCSVAVKSALSRDLMESQERVDAVIRACGSVS